MRSLPELQVLQPIIRLVSVYVMHAFRTEKDTAKRLRYHKAMFWNVVCSIPHLGIRTIVRYKNCGITSIIYYPTALP